MPTQEYRNAKGERIPGNTTIIGANLGWSKNALMFWSWRQGKDGKDFRETREVAADVGTLCHAMIEDNIKGSYKAATLTGLTDEMLCLAKQGFESYLEWKQGIKLELVNMEVSLISERYQYGTTVDIVAKANGRLCLVECKTSNAVYEDYLIQISAQEWAWNENHPSDPIQGVHLLKVNKESAAFTHHFWQSLPGCFEAFLDLRDLHDRKKQLKKLM